MFLASIDYSSGKNEKLFKMRLSFKNYIQVHLNRSTMKSCLFSRRVCLNFRKNISSRNVQVVGRW